MSSLFGIGAGSASTGFYPETIGQSLRFEDGDSPYLDRTPSSETDRDKFTWSCWIKRGVLDQLLVIFQHGPSNNNSTGLFLETDNTLVYQHADGGGATDKVQTNAKLRDITGFYHIALAVDTTQSTDSNRVRLYINGVYQSSLATANYPTQNTDTDMNTTNKFRISGQTAGTQFPFDGYMAEVNFLDGIQVGDTQDSNGDYILDEFGETKNGVWIPKAYSGSYGTNGFRLTFADSSSIGDDTSGNGNDFTSSGLASTDVVLDSPTNNFPTLNSIGNDTQVTFSEGDLKVSVPQDINAQPRCEGTFAVSSGKWYWEVNVISITTATTPMIGIKDLSVSGHESHIFSGSSVYAYYANSGNKYNSGNLGSYGATYTAGDIIGVALDLDAGTLTFYKNNSSQGTAFSSLSGEYTLHLGTGYYAWVGVVNFGQDGTFAGNETAQGNTDDNGIGDFYYSPPSGHLALCSANLSDTTLSPNQLENASDYFNTKLWTGTGASADAKTGVGFQPDWLWAKDRNYANGHHLFDSSRGVDNYLSSDSTASETNNSGYALQSFDADGFTTVGQGINYLNVSDYVGWNWRCGGTTPTKTYKVVVVSDSGNKYRFRNSSDSATFASSAVTLDLQEGGTYTFDLSDSSMSGHPLRFSSTSDGTHGGGSEYTTGVTTSGTAGSSGATVTITVASSAPTLYYYCSNHSGMGGQINTNSTFGQTNFDGSILSVEQSNTTAGFSIVLYTGTGTNGETVGHGLGLAPSVCIIKSRTNSGYNWAYWHKDLTSGAKLYLDGIFAEITGQPMFNNSSGTHTIPTSTLLTLSGSSVANYALVNGSGSNHIAYVFAEVEGYSKYGSFVGSGSADGVYVNLGFRPRMIIFKDISTSTESWYIVDTARDTHNPVTKLLFPNDASAEYDSSPSYPTDFLSNGFKIRNASFPNTSGRTYIYMAWGDGQTAKFSNAR